MHDRQPRGAMTKRAAFFALVSAFASAGALAQPLSFRAVASTLPFTPLHSHVAGHLGESVIAFGGISGQGMHSIAQATGIVAFPLSVYNENIYLLDQGAGTLRTASTAHLSPALRQRLRKSNAGEVQFGSYLYVYGGYGPVSETEWFTAASALRIDLAVVDEAIRAGSPVPESAFTIIPCPQAEVAGTVIVKLGGGKFALVGGSNFRGDYGLGESNPQPFSNNYSDSVHIFDASQGYAAPTDTFTDAFWLHRRDLNAMPVTLPDGAPGATRSGFAMVCGVFNGPGPWENPATYALGDNGVMVFDTYTQKMNQYEAGNISFYNGDGQNRLVILGGLSFQVWDGTDFYYDFLVPWVTDITEQTMDDGNFVSGAERVIGQMPLPLTNTRLFLRPNIPVYDNGQVRLRDLPHNEHLIARTFGGLSAVNPGPEPTTFASANVYDVYVVVGVRGDVDKDGAVAFSDLNIILSQFGLIGPLFTYSGDLNLDGTVSFADLNIVLSNFGSSTPG